jgi:hypothetical protein
MIRAAAHFLIDGRNGVKSQWKSRLYLCFVIARMDLFYNRKNKPVLKISNIMILLVLNTFFLILYIILNSKYNFKILNIVFDEILTKKFATLNPYFDQN